MAREPSLSTRLVGVAWVYIGTSLLLGWVVPRLVHGPLGWFNPVLRPEQRWRVIPSSFNRRASLPGRFSTR